MFKWIKIKFLNYLIHQELKNGRIYSDDTNCLKFLKWSLYSPKVKKELSIEEYENFTTNKAEKKIAKGISNTSFAVAYKLDTKKPKEINKLTLYRKPHPLIMRSKKI